MDTDPSVLSIQTQASPFLGSTDTSRTIKLIHVITRKTEALFLLASVHIVALKHRCIWQGNFLPQTSPDLLKKAETTAVAICEARKDRKQTDVSNQYTETVLVTWESSAMWFH